MAPDVLAEEARRNLELLMIHDPKKIDGVAIHMQILNTTRAKTRSRKMGQAFRLSEVLPRVKVPMTGIWGEFDSTTYPFLQERIDLFRAVQPDFQMNVIEGAGHWVAYEAAEAFNARLLEVLTP
jgi:2-hydroxy-6-oxonona-2,4-dienedioate hydrolase